MAVKERLKRYIIFGGKVRSEIHLFTTEDRGGFRYLEQKRSNLWHLWKSSPFGVIFIRVSETASVKEALPPCPGPRAAMVQAVTLKLLS